MLIGGGAYILLQIKDYPDFYRNNPRFPIPFSVLLIR